MQKMQQVLKHYGRDTRATYLNHNIGLGCCLNKIGTYTQADVPVYEEKLGNYILVGDALLYNRKEIAEACHLLEEELLSTQDLLMAAYLKWGEDCPKYLNGDFTFAIWN